MFTKIAQPDCDIALLPLKDLLHPLLPFVAIRTKSKASFKVITDKSVLLEITVQFLIPAWQWSNG
jgi:hypothetical protein